MEWLNDPPCTRLDPGPADKSGRKLELIGPATASRVTGGVVAGFGAVFGSVAMSFLRLPVPAPFKVLPLAFTVIGGSVSALGVAAATAKVSVLFERGKGARFRWKIGPMRQRELFVPLEDIAGFEVQTSSHQTNTDKHGFGGSTVYTYQLKLVTKAGKALSVEEFGLRTQANLRQAQIEEVLRGTKAEAPHKQTGSRGRRAAGKGGR